MRDHLGVGVRSELVAERSEPGADRLVVLDDAVVHHRDPAADVRVGVALGGRAVRGPAGVADADGALQADREARQLGDAAGTPDSFQTAIDDGDAGRVVAAVLQPPQPFDQDRDDVTPRYRGDDSAHAGFPCRNVSTPAVIIAAGAAQAKSTIQAPRNITAPGTSHGRLPSVAIHSTSVSAAYARKLHTACHGWPAMYGEAPSATICSAMAAAAARNHGFSIRILVLSEHHHHRLQDDLQVEQQRPAAQVGEVVVDARLHLLDRDGLAAQAVDLGEAGNSGLHLVADHVAADQLAVELVVRDRVRARADHAHAPLQHVDELRQLVERGAAQEGAEAGDAAVVARRLAHHVAILGHGHRAELVDHDLAAVDAVAALLEQDRAGRGALDADGDREQQRRDQRQDQAGEHHVAQALA